MVINSYASHTIFPSIRTLRKSIPVKNRTMHPATDSWNEKDFKALLLIYASKADGAMSDPEEGFIRSKLGEAALESALALFEAQSEYDNIQTIMQLKERFYPGQAGKEQLHADLIALFEADGEFSHIEEYILIGLERLFG